MPKCDFKKVAFQEHLWRAACVAKIKIAKHIAIKKNGKAKTSTKTKKYIKKHQLLRFP